MPLIKLLEVRYALSACILRLLQMLDKIFEAKGSNPLHFIYVTVHSYTYM